MDNFIPIFIDGMNQFLPEINSYISNCNEEYIITSRLDNDDSIGVNFIDEIQKRFHQQDFLALDFIDGYTLQIQPNIRLGYKIHPFNPFISLIEKNKNPKTVWSSSHTDWKKENRIKQIREVRIWTSVIHHENKVNEFTGFGAVDIKKFCDKFIISENQINIVKNNSIPVSNWRLLSTLNYISSL